MPKTFEQRHQEIIKKTILPPGIKLWLKTSGFSLVVFGLASLYIYLQKGRYELFEINQAVAGTAVFLIGGSLALSGICYFWDFLDSKIIYRKHLGIAGFAFGLVHALIILIPLQDRFSFPGYYFQDASHLLVFSAAVTAVVLFALLTAISNRYAIQELGGKRWRLILRYGGYAGLIFTLIHFGVNQYPRWISWYQSGATIWPPISLLEFIFGVLVLALRLILWLALLKAKKNQIQTGTPTL